MRVFCMVYDAAKGTKELPHGHYYAELGFSIMQLPSSLFFS